jgi:hypothetical protein
LDIEDFGKKPPKNVVFWKASYNKARNILRRFLPKAPLALKASGFVWEEEPIFWNSPLLFSTKKGRQKKGKPYDKVGRGREGAFFLQKKEKERKKNK